MNTYSPSDYHCSAIAGINDRAKQKKKNRSSFWVCIVSFYFYTLQCDCSVMLSLHVVCLILGICHMWILNLSRINSSS